ncbi:MAG TPA: ester cyclase [Anaerolineae bacterium]
MIAEVEVKPPDDGYPAYEPIDQTRNIASKRRVMAIMQQILDAPLPELNEAVCCGYCGDAAVSVSHPINELSSPGALAAEFWKPLRQALPDVERRYDVLAGGLYHGTAMVGCLGHYVGTFERDWLGIPATGSVVAVRYAEGHELRDGRLARSYIFVDFLDLMRQAGYWPIAPSLGREMQWLSPMTHDGVILTAQDESISERTHGFIRRMHTALGIYTDGQPLTRGIMQLIELEDARHFHPKFLWYGPAGIGTTRGVAGFNDYHGHPFVMAFPDRGGDRTPHFIRISDGRYAVTGGWGHLEGTHTGNDFLGLAATGKHVHMRVMDFYRCSDETICENWVPIDIPHLLNQLGVDVFRRMEHQARQNNRRSVKSWLLRE